MAGLFTTIIYDSTINKIMFNVMFAFSEFMDYHILHVNAILTTLQSVSIA